MAASRTSPHTIEIVEVKLYVSTYVYDKYTSVDRQTVGAFVLLTKVDGLWYRPIALDLDDCSYERYNTLGMQ